VAWIAVDRVEERTFIDTALICGEFAGERLKNLVRIVRLDPALQKFCGNRKVSVLFGKSIEFEAPEPRCENVFTKFLAHTLADSHPGFAFARALKLGLTRRNQVDPSASAAVDDLALV
jgi:hypothetical protein